MAEETQSFLSGTTTLSSYTVDHPSVQSMDTLTYSTTSSTSDLPSLSSEQLVEARRMRAYYHQHRQEDAVRNDVAPSQLMMGFGSSNSNSISPSSYQQHQRYHPEPYRQPQSSSNVYRPIHVIDRILQSQNPQQQRRHQQQQEQQQQQQQQLDSEQSHPQTLGRCLTSPRVILTVAVCLVIVGNLVIGSEFLEHALELGVAGVFAQHRANLVQSKVFAPSLQLSLQVSPKGLKPKADVAQDQQEGCESTIMLIRHCEKSSLRSHCSFLGYERSVYLAEQFGSETADRWPAPTEIYAMKAGGRKHGNINYREVETVKPLSTKVGVEVNQEYDTKTTSVLAKHLLEQILGGEMCGKMVLVSWKHSDMARLAQHLGCGPLQGCPWDYHGKEFDEVWQIRYAYALWHNGKTGKASYKWNVFGSVQHEKFDPLAFSKSVGDYPEGGTSSGTLAHFEAGNFMLYG